jgi:hypothetical protein
MTKKLAPLPEIDYTVHGSNRMGRSVCGTTKAGRGQALTEKRPELWARVDCVDCLRLEQAARLVDIEINGDLDRMATAYVGLES